MADQNPFRTSLTLLWVAATVRLLYLAQRTLCRDHDPRGRVRVLRPVCRPCVRRATRVPGCRFLALHVQTLRRRSPRDVAGRRQLKTPNEKQEQTREVNQKDHPTKNPRET